MLIGLLQSLSATPGCMALPSLEHRLQALAPPPSPSRLRQAEGQGALLTPGSNRIPRCGLATHRTLATSVPCGVVIIIIITFLTLLVLIKSVMDVHFLCDGCELTRRRAAGRSGCGGALGMLYILL